MYQSHSGSIKREIDSETGILLVNTGTPDEPTPAAVRRFLAEFLSDPRVVDYPRWLWLPLLHLVILNLRPRRSARLYHKIWKGGASPLLKSLEHQAFELSESLHRLTAFDIPVAYGMRYGSPSISSRLLQLGRAGIKRILVLPLFPQYSGTTTGSVYDAVYAEVNKQDPKPEVLPVKSYHDCPAYIQALTASIHDYWEENTQPERLLFSFHGIPARYERKGDLYRRQCIETSQLVAAELGINQRDWGLSYQSRFGPERWIQPYTDRTLALWAQSGVRSVHVTAPGFSADCLETLYELDMEGRQIFLDNGGENFGYIPALNEKPSHIDMMAQIVLEKGQVLFD